MFLMSRILYFDSTKTHFKAFKIMKVLNSLRQLLKFSNTRNITFCKIKKTFKLN